MKNDFIVLSRLVGRGLKIFLTDKASVFFSLLAPLIIFFLYVMFLGDIQMETMRDVLKGMPLEDDVMRAFVDGWMLAGVMSVSCITVSFSAQNIMIRDRELGVVSDMLTSPVKRSVLSVSYLIYNFIVTIVICLGVLVISLCYLAISGWYLSAGDVFAMFGLLFLSVLASSLLSTLLCMFIKTQSAHSGFVGILSAAMGFFIGAYMPLALFPKAVQYFVLVIPGTYSAGIFRHLFMRGSLAEISAVSPEVGAELEKAFSMNLDFFGASIGDSVMWAILAGSIALLAAAYLIVRVVKAKNNTLFLVASSPKRRAKARIEDAEESSS